MRFTYDGKISVKKVFNRKIFLKACRRATNKKEASCLTDIALCHAKDDRELLQKWLMDCDLHRFKFAEEDLPNPSRSTKCPICFKMRKDITKHFEKKHEGIRNFYLTRVQVHAYSKIVLPVLRLNVWAVYPVLRKGCPLCRTRDLTTLEDGSPHTYPWRCVRFESGRSKCWSVRSFGAKWKEPNKTDIFFYLLCEKGEDSCKISTFAKNFR